MNLRFASDLNQYVGLGQIEGCVGDFGDENSVDFGVMLEVLQDLHPLVLRRRAVNIRLPHPNGVG